MTGEVVTRCVCVYQGHSIEVANSCVHANNCSSTLTPVLGAILRTRSRGVLAVRMRSCKICMGNAAQSHFCCAYHMSTCGAARLATGVYKLPLTTSCKNWLHRRASTSNSGTEFCFQGLHSCHMLAALWCQQSGSQRPCSAAAMLVQGWCRKRLRTRASMRLVCMRAPRVHRQLETLSRA